MSRAILVLLGLSLLAAASPLDRYNEGVEKLAAGKVEDAIADFEGAAVASEGKLRASAFLNLAVAHATRGDAILADVPKEEVSRDAKVSRLKEAAESYRRALALFRRVTPPADDAEQGAKAAKVRLLSVLDDLQKLAEEAKKEAEEAALKDPPGLLLRTLTGERDRRREASRLDDLPKRRRRLPARRLRKAEYEARTLTEKLAAALESPPPAAKGAAEPGKAPAAAPPEVAKEAAEAVRRGAKAMADAEGRLDGRDAKGAAEAQTRAIGELTAAARRLPAPLPALVAKLADDQESLLSLTQAGPSPLHPLEQGEVRGWLSLLARLPDPPADAKGKGQMPAETVAKIRELAGEADAAAGRAVEHLEAGRLEASEPEQETVVAKLHAIQELLPRPPVPPAERIRKLLEEEHDVADSVGALAGLGPEARAEEEEGLGTRQTENGREAGSIAKELEGSPGQREKEAAKKVRSAEEEIHASSESLRRDRTEPAGEAVGRAIADLEEALRILSGEKDRQRRDESRQNGQGKKDQPEQKEKGKGKQDARKLTSREARRMMEKLDRERREEEKKLFRGIGGPKVEKDW